MANFSHGWVAKTSRSTGIAAQAIAAGANYLGSEIDRTSDTPIPDMAEVELTFASAVSPAAGSYVEIYMLIAADGTNYEDGGVGTDPIKTRLKPVNLPADTSTHRITFQCSIPPSKFKLLIKSESNQSVTCTLLCYTYHSRSVQE